MKSARLEQMIGGWFVGDFDPSVLRSRDVEVAVKHYAAGAHDAAHFHKIATEVTVIVSGRARMGDREWSAGDIIVVEPGEVSEFVAITDVALVAVKLPSVMGDKYMADT